MVNFQTVTIIGLGLIGGSFALALKKAGYEGTIIGYDVERKVQMEALEANAIDIAAENIERAVVDNGLVVMAVPLGVYPVIFRELAQVAEGRRLIISDVGSVKTYVQQLADELLPYGSVFVGGHPMAGSERDGFGAARADLFQDACYFLTPAASHQEEIVAAIKKIAERLGAWPVVTSSEEHDRVVAVVSHVPHLVAALLASSLGSSEAPFVGTGFRDTTRIAAGNPQLWKDILIYNRKEILAVIERIENLLGGVKNTLHNGDRVRLTDFLRQAKYARDRLYSGDRAKQSARS